MLFCEVAILKGLLLVVCNFGKIGRLDKIDLGSMCQ